MCTHVAYSIQLQASQENDRGRSAAVLCSFSLGRRQQAAALP